MLYAQPKPVQRGPKAKRPIGRNVRPKQQRDSERAALIRALDDGCRRLVKTLAGYRCEMCGAKPECGHLDWAHGEGRAQAWRLRWSHCGTFALCRTCHAWSEASRKGRAEFAAWRRATMCADAWERVTRLEQERDRTPIRTEELGLILADLRSGVFRQGGKMRPWL